MQPSMSVEGCMISHGATELMLNSPSCPPLAKLAVRRSIATEIERATRHFRVPSGMVVSLEVLMDGPEPWEPETAFDAEQAAIDRLHYQAIESEAFARTADAIDQAILTGIQADRTLEETAWEVGLSPAGPGTAEEPPPGPAQGGAGGRGLGRLTGGFK
jgi:hypothetical protein